jgi:hypothetical protein
MQLYDFQPNGWIPNTTNLPVWLTEYNLNDQFTGNNTVFGTWAHGLFLATMDLKFLENGHIQKLAHHETLGTGQFADIFADSNGLSGVTFKNPPSPATNPWGFTAGGLISIQINAAARGQTMAQKLDFNGAPDILTKDHWGVTTGIMDSPFSYPSLYGWTFSGPSISHQAVILNLLRASQTIDLSTVLPSGGSYVQISSNDPSPYITGFVDSSNNNYPEGVTLNGTKVDLIQTPIMSIADRKSFMLPAFSLTRIIY